MSQRTRKLAAALTVLAFVLMVISAMPLKTATAATTSYAKPTQTQVNNALNLAGTYLSGLINPDNHTYAVLPPTPGEPATLNLAFSSNSGLTTVILSGSGYMHSTTFSACIVTGVGGCYASTSIALATTNSGTIPSNTVITVPANLPSGSQYVAIFTVRTLIVWGYRGFTASQYDIVSEYYALPLSVVLPSGSTWNSGTYYAGNSNPEWPACTASPVANSQSYSSETETIDFTYWAGPLDSAACSAFDPAVTAAVNWAYSPTTAQVCLANTEYDTYGGGFPLPASVNLYFGTTHVAALSSSNVGQKWCLTIPLSAKSDFASYRYTIRHGEQLAVAYASESGQSLTEINAIKSFITNQGYSLGFDIYSPMANTAALNDHSLPDSYTFYVNSSSSSTDVYWDCNQASPYYSSLTHYRYNSKVCLDVQDYSALVAPADALTPMLWALHLLEKYGHPDTAYCAVNQAGLDINLFGTSQNCWTPRNVMRYVETHYLAHDGSGNLIGVATCSKYSILQFFCNYGVGSQPRTSIALALESELGYVYGDAASVGYANSFAQILLQTQVTGNTFTVVGGSTYYRPLQKGGFMTLWDGFAFYSNTTTVSRFVDSFGMTSEYSGVSPANQEATQTAWLALNFFSSVAYSTGGGGGGGGGGCPHLPCVHPDPPFDSITGTIIQVIPVVVLIGVVGFVAVYLRRFGSKSG